MQTERETSSQSHYAETSIYYLTLLNQFLVACLLGEARHLGERVPAVVGEALTSRQQIKAPRGVFETFAQLLEPVVEDSHFLLQDLGGVFEVGRPRALAVVRRIQQVAHLVYLAL